MQHVELFVSEAQHTPELGRICFEAFRQISERDGFEHDFTDAETAAKVISLIQSLPGSFQVAARWNGRLAGSNFVLLTDGVAGSGRSPPAAASAADRRWNVPVISSGLLRGDPAGRDRAPEGKS